MGEGRPMCDCGKTLGHPGPCPQPRVRGAVLMLAVVLGALFTLTACDVTPGGACSQEGSKATNKNGVSYTCKQVPGGKRIWQQDAPLTPDRP